MMPKRDISVEALRHQDKRRNIPTAELEPVMDEKDKTPIRLAYERRNRDLDPQLVWRGKDEQDWSDLIVQAPPLYIQEKVHPKVLVDDLLRQSKARAKETAPPMPDLFADFNGLPDREALTEFYQHDANWSNRMISGDSLSVMASLAEREGLRGKVQCIYIDPPYGIRFNSNFQWSTTTRDVKDGNKDHITREPEQVQAFRDTWRDGIHSYLTYLRDRLTVARDLLADSGSIFVQIGEENVHLLRSVMDEVFGENNFVVQLILEKTGTLVGDYVESINDYILWFAKNKEKTKFRRALSKKIEGAVVGYQYLETEFSSKPVSQSTNQERDNGRLWGSYPLHSQGFRNTTTCSFSWQGRSYHPGMTRNWKVATDGLTRLGWAGRIVVGPNVLRFKRYFDDFRAINVSNNWDETFTAGDRIYVVQTSAGAVQRCVLMATDPGDLVLDPTCGSGTTAYVAEQWGRRWVTIDTSRVALALARARIMGARYPYYLTGRQPRGAAERR
jgi:adenine-specific DNA-methyltransferase